MLQRYKITVAYRGTRYHGWQQQAALPSYKGERDPAFVPPPEHDDAPDEPPPPSGLAAPGVGPAPGLPVDYIPTIQGELTKAITEVVGHSINLVGSSRTDAGVHAKGQVCHFDTDKVQIPREGMRRAINHRLPSDILVRTIEPAAETFNAVTSTRTKRYQFLIWSHPDRPLFFSDLAWHRWHYLDVPKIIEAAAHFVGTHDFASFARPGHGRENTVRTVFACDVRFRSPKLIIGVEGGGFLWNMVRIMVGTLVQVGLGRTRPDEIPAMLAARDRRAAGPTAPPHGLYLQWIKTESAPSSDVSGRSGQQISPSTPREIYPDPAGYPDQSAENA